MAKKTNAKQKTSLIIGMIVILGVMGSFYFAVNISPHINLQFIGLIEKFGGKTGMAGEASSDRTFYTYSDTVYTMVGNQAYFYDHNTDLWTRYIPPESDGTTDFLNRPPFTQTHTNPYPDATLPQPSNNGAGGTTPGGAGPGTTGANGEQQGPGQVNTELPNLYGQHYENVYGGEWYNSNGEYYYKTTDGSLEYYWFDRNNDRILDSFYEDTNADGTVDYFEADYNNDGYPDLIGSDENSDGAIDENEFYFVVDGGSGSEGIPQTDLAPVAESAAPSNNARRATPREIGVLTNDAAALTPQTFRTQANKDGYTSIVPGLYSQIGDQRYDVYTDDSGNYYYYDGSSAVQVPWHDFLHLPQMIGNTPVTVNYAVSDDGSSVNLEFITLNRQNFHVTEQELTNLRNRAGDTSTVSLSNNGQKLTIVNQDQSRYELERGNGITTERSYNSQGQPTRVTVTEQITVPDSNRQITRTTNTDYQTRYYDAEGNEVSSNAQGAVPYILPSITITEGNFPVARITPEVVLDDDGNPYVEMSGIGYNLEVVNNLEDLDTVEDSRYTSYYGDFDRNGDGYLISVDEEGVVTYSPYEHNELQMSGIVIVDDINGLDPALLSPRDAAKIDKIKEEAKRALEAAQRRRTQARTFDFIRIFTQFRGLSGYSSLFISQEELNKWKETVDQWFAKAYLGTEYWESALCASNIEIDQDNIAFIETPSGIVTPAASIKGDRLTSGNLETGNATYIYKITYFIMNQRTNLERAEFETQPIVFNVQLQGDQTIEIYNEDKEVAPEESFNVGRDQPFVFESSKRYEKVCIVFKSDFYIVDSRLSPSKVEEICDKFSDATGAPSPWTEPVTNGGTPGSPAGDINPGIY